MILSIKSPFYFKENAGAVARTTTASRCDESDVRVAIEEVYQRHLVQSLEYEDVSYYQIHPLIREFLQTKLQESAQINELKQAFTSTFIEIAQTIPETTTLEDIKSVKNAIPHLTEVAENHLDAVSDENLYWAFTGLAYFYKGQGLYTVAEPWSQQCLLTVRERLGENHPDTATSLNNLAELYRSQGKYEQAEPLLIQALELIKQLLGVNHPHTATSLNNLAELYRSQGKYEQAEPLFIQALELRKQLQGVNHPDVAMSLNNLANLDYSQGRYEAAEPLYIQALEIAEQTLGANHPNTVTIRNSLEYLRAQQGEDEDNS
ncbi:MAG: tetratricopeptide repeat protein [Nostocales cyanobacterium 94392]|nr:tetratricopeptide repeat protein [Nostocales cyanobacterium 94392]